MERQVSVVYNTKSDVRMMVAECQKFDYIIVNICSNDALESEVAAEQDVDSLTLMDCEIADEDAGRQQVKDYPVSLLLTKLEIVEQDILEQLLTVGDGAKYIPGHIIFFAGNNK